jgi:K+-sensing histidine kinase KdpD
MIGEALAYVSGDSTGIELAVANLLNNAEKYSSRSEPIDISVQTAGSWVTTAIINHGPALQAEKYELLWGIHQHGSSPDISVTGSGIGLTLCRELVEVMGGRVWAGPCDNGSIFTIALPKASAMDAADGEPAQRPVQMPSAWEGGPGALRSA